MDLIGILNQMSSAFNNESSNTDKKEGIDLSNDKTLKWRGLHNNTSAMKDGKSLKRSKRLKSDQSGKSNDSFSSESKNANSKVQIKQSSTPEDIIQTPPLIEEQIKAADNSTEDNSINRTEQTNNTNGSTHDVIDSKEVALIEPTIDTVTIIEDEESISAVVQKEPESDDIKPSLDPPLVQSEDLLAQMSNNFNQALLTQSKEIVLHMTEDKTLKWRALHNNQFAAKEKEKVASRKSVRGVKSDTQDKDEVFKRVGRKSKRFDDPDTSNTTAVTTAIQEPEIPNVVEATENKVVVAIIIEEEVPEIQENESKEEETTNIAISESNKDCPKEENTEVLSLKTDDDKKSKPKVNKTVNKSDRSLRSKNSTEASHIIKQEIKIETNNDNNKNEPSQEEPVENNKRRGRRKLEKSVEDQAEKPKRGRGRKQVNTTEKPETKESLTDNTIPDKPITITDEQKAEIEIKVEISPEPEKKKPRKRGRKPKVLDESNNSLKDKPKTYPVKKSPRLSKDGSESILASAIARQKNDASGMQTRLSRPLKPTAKILANEELRYGFEQQQNARLSLSNENIAMDAESSPKKENKTVHEEMVAPPEPKPVAKSHPKKPAVENVPIKKDDSNVSSVKCVNNKETSSNTTAIQSPTPQPEFVSKIVIEKITAVPSISSHIPQKRPCPDPEQFLHEIKQFKIGLHRSPEDNKKLNRKQQKKLFKQKEKHLQMLGLTKASKLNNMSSDSDSSEDENEEFLPSKKVNVTKPTLRLRNSHLPPPVPKQPVISSDKINTSHSRPGRKRRNLSLSTTSSSPNVKTVEQPPAALPKVTSPKGAPTATFSNKTIMVEIPCSLICMCRNKTRYFIQKTSERSFCTAIDEIDGKKVGCCNELSGSLINLVRPSVRVSYVMLCDVHRRRMRAHNCCAGCGVFCTQGNFVLCSNKHVFHKDCAEKFILNAPYNPQNPNFTCPTLVLKCPHCGVDAANNDYQITMKSNHIPIFLPTQKSYIKPSKMTVPSNNVRPKNSFLLKMEKLIPKSILNILLEANENLKSQQPRSFTAKDFFYAIYNNNDISKIAEIIASGFDLSTPFKEIHNGTCLHLVSNFGSLVMSYLILCRTNSVDYLNILDKEMRSAIMCAVLGGKNDILKLLIQSGANVTLKGPDGMTVLHLSAKIGNLAAAKIILDSYRETASSKKMEMFLNCVDDGNWTALVWAAENKHKDFVAYLISLGANVNVCDLENNTVIHWGALSGDVETLYPLLTSTCDVNIQNINGDTALHIACRNSDTNICMLLISHGADLIIKNLANETPLDGIPNEDSECANIMQLNIEMRKISGIMERKIVAIDISNGREKYPIQMVSSVDYDDMIPDFKYITKNILLQNNVQIDTRISQMRVCNCSDYCISENCQCGQISIQHWYTVEGKLIEEFNYNDPPMIFECNDVCGCNKIMCKNRVVQKGLKFPLQIFECGEKTKGWGVKALTKITKGNFICEYIGEILTDMEADRRTDDSFFFDLGASEHCIDANYYGNVSRFFNHSCDANVVPVRVYYDHQDLRFPKIAFFALRDIEIDDEICFDYGEKFWSVKCKTISCHCMTSLCRYKKKL